MLLRSTFSAMSSATRNALYRAAPMRRSLVAGPVLSRSLATASTPSSTDEAPDQQPEVNPYLLKYREKLAQKISEKGGKVEKIDPEQEMQRFFKVPETTEKLREGWKKLHDQVQAGTSNKVSTGEEQKVFNARRLSEILNLEKVRQLSPEALQQLWSAHFANRARHVSGSMPAEDYATMAARAADSPLFIYALPRPEGNEFFISQYSRHQMFFTTLLEYKTHGENARALLTLTNYVDLIKDTGIVLCLAEYDDKLLSATDAQTLLEKMRVHLTDPAKYDLVRRFNHEPANFDYTQLL